MEREGRLTLQEESKAKIAVAREETRGKEAEAGWAAFQASPTTNDASHGERPATTCRSGRPRLLAVVDTDQAG